MSDNTNKYADVPIRIRSWVIIILVLGISLLSPLLTCLFVCFLSFVGMKEYLIMQKWENSVKTNSVLFVLTILQYYVLYYYTYIEFIYFILFYITSIQISNYFIPKIQNKEVYLKSSLAIVLCVFSISHIMFIRELPPNFFDNIDGIKLLLYLIILTEFNDVFQYLSGKKYGKHKITPKISPNKTVEGMIGGLLLTTILAHIIGFLFFPNAKIFMYSIVGISISILGILGDLYMSSVKRKAAVKDTSTLIPGHGGLLDRIDSLLFVTPLYYWFVFFFYPQIL